MNKSGACPTKAQKLYISKHKLNWKHWLVVKDTEETFKIISKVTGERKTLEARK